MISVRIRNNLKSAMAKISNRLSGGMDDAKKAGERTFRRESLSLGDIEPLPKPDQLLLKAMGAVDETGQGAEARKKAEKSAAGAVMKVLSRIIGK